METKDTLSSCSNSEAQQKQHIQDKAKKSCMVSFRQLHTHLKRLSQNDLQRSRTESRFKRAFATLFGQDIETFTGTMFLNLKREYDSWANERQMQTTEEKVDTSKALDDSSVDTESNRTESNEQDTSSRSRNDAHADDADIRPIYDEEPMAESQFLKEKSNEAKVKHDIDVLETTNIELEHKVAKLLKENETLKKHYKELFDSIKIMRAKTIEHTTSLIATNDKFKAQLQEKGFAIAALKNKLRKLKGNSVNTKFAKQSILGKSMSQSHRNQSVVRQPTAFKSKRPRISEPRFASQVDVNHDLSKPVTTHYLPKEREAASAKPQHMIASSNSRNSSKNMPRFSSNDVVHNHYLEEAKKKTQERSRNSKPSLMPSARSQSIANVGVRWVPIGKIFASSTTKVDSEPLNGSNADITNQYECEQTLDVSACTLNLSACTSLNPKEEGLRVCLELGLHDHSKEQSSSKLVPDVVPPADKTDTSRQDLEFLFHHHITRLRSYALSWKPCQGDSLNLLDHRYQVYQERLLASFQDEAKYEHGGQETRTEGGKRRSRQKDKDLKISDEKTKSKDNNIRLKIKDRKA
nr:hypothetical protein [Tanacetum cinerariifolium]